MRHLIPFLKAPPMVPVIRLSGVIATSGRLGSVLNDDALAPVIERAFRRGKPAAVALVINSPGGAPVQTALIAARIRRLAEEKRIPVHAFVEDIAASGGYWLASAADHIWLDDCSIVGSIGVVSSGFGLHELIGRYGVERRLYTAGSRKSLLDPFRPEDPEDVARVNRIISEMHRTFIGQVRARRGARLTEAPGILEGEIWVGAEAVRVGLADGIAHPVPKLKDIYGDKVRLVPLGLRRPFLQRFGAALTAAAIAGVEERALWARYGL